MSFQNRALLTIIFALVFIFTITLCKAEAQSSLESHINQENTYKVVGYVAGWRNDWSSDNIDAAKLTHINYAFADIVDGKIASYLDNDEANFEVLNSLKQDNPNLKILISVGGWSRSKFFSD